MLIERKDLPKGGKVVKVHELGLSDWYDTTKYDVELPNGTIESFFEKVGATGYVPLLQWN